MKYPFLLLSFLLIFSCQKPTQNEEIIIEDEVFEETVPDGHTSQLALDYLGVYTGVLPCADCEGIETTITLKENEEYSRKMVYLGKTGGNTHESSGKFSWNEAGNTISLTGEDAPNQYFVGENVLFHLDQDGNRITGNLADNYRLNKQ
ncbi:copper resistance protein NlpE [Pararhodonellum marinum]|uniref:copper resistance protein NlpE n=1 Tax=Pararhodonellum marinum TaxID=2755358 RepID=UPI00188FD2ED|nr:copper resistance protein NlpE [Pararhodonellum marinum]